MPGLDGAPLTVVFGAVQPGIGRWPWNAVAFAKPLQQVAILAAAAAERRMVGRARLVAQRAALGGSRRVRHGRRKWRAWGRRAR